MMTYCTYEMSFHFSYVFLVRAGNSNLLVLQPKNAQQHEKVQKASTEGVAIQGQQGTRLLPEQLIREAFILSDLFDIGELAAVELLLAGNVILEWEQADLFCSVLFYSEDTYLCFRGMSVSLHSSCPFTPLAELEQMIHNKQKQQIFIITKAGIISCRMLYACLHAYIYTPYLLMRL